MYLILATCLSLASQTDPNALAQWANKVPLHGTVHEGTLYGFFGTKTIDQVQIFALPVQNTGKNIKRYHLRHGDHDYYYRHHLGFGALWYATGHRMVARMPLDDLNLFDLENPKWFGQFNHKYETAKKASFVDWFRWPLRDLEMQYERQRTKEEMFIPGDAPFRRVKDVVGTDVFPTSETSCRVFFYGRKEKSIESWETHAKLFTRTEPTRIVADNKNSEWIEAAFEEDFSAFIRGQDYFFVTESGKLYHAPPREEGQKKRKMREVWTEPTLPIVAIISDADNDKVWLFVKNKSKGGKADLYLEMRDVARFKEIDPAQLAKVKDVESPRARQLLEYIPLIRPDLVKKPAP